jgi:hypothetical protein
MSDDPTRAEDLQRCTLCDTLVDPASLADVVYHFFDGGCVTGADRRDGLAAIRGVKVSSDA